MRTVTFEEYVRLAMSHAIFERDEEGNWTVEIPVGGGKHVYMRYPETGLKIPISIHGGRDIPVGTLRRILRILYITVEGWNRL